MQSINAFSEKVSHKRVRRYHRRKHNIFISVVVTLAFAAFLLLLLVAISMPIIKAVYLLRVDSTSAPELIPTSIATELRFGVWGYCATSVLDIPTLFTNDGECSKPRLGYDVDANILAITGQTQLLEILLKALVVVLVLHPICAGLAFITLFFAVFSFAHAPAICSLVFAIASAILTSVSAAVDIAIVAIAMAKVGDVTNLDFAVHWGNAPWMTLVAAVLLWIVVILQSATLCGCCGVSQRLWTRIDQSGEEKK
ncbi:hypothetical protein EW145_g5897 [Phellinidium pouzarii]|uniref:Pali-domain-containing protein n=1 Tax=Phellinidium pouzarii TaxID=167371 RepID=A0A4V3XC04_9AGAM|nr:hypothetical protein EW145_g5897 [Phellinidium pouzarii]